MSDQHALAQALEEGTFAPNILQNETSLRLAAAAELRRLHERVQELEAQRVPEGWQLVPIEPTAAMLDAAHQGDREYNLRAFGREMNVPQGGEDHWAAMLAAAPAPANTENTTGNQE